MIEANSWPAHVNEPINNNAKPAPSDEEIAALLAGAAGKDKRKKRDMDAPTPRLPEALYFYIFIVLEAVLLMGVWGFMRMGTQAVTPGIEDASVVQWLTFNFKSMIDGIGSLLRSMPWIPVAVLAAAGVVFVPVTPRRRKRTATLVSTLIVCVFVLLIAMQFSEDMANLTRSA
jgi:hypothetical protein